MKLQLTNIGFLRVAGPDAQTFLQGQLTCDLTQLTNDNSILGAYLNQKGRIIATMRVFIWQNDYWLQAPIDTLPLLEQSLKRFAVFSKVTINNVSDDFTILALHNVTPNPSPEIKINELNDQRFEIICKKTQFQDLKYDTETADPHYWDLLDIQSGIPTIVAATQQQFLPQPIHYDELGVSFNKGCYMGQEIVARMHYRGTPKQHLYCVQITTNESLKFGEPIIAASINREIGELVMGVHQNNALLALVTLFDESAVDQDVLVNQVACRLEIQTRY